MSRYDLGVSGQDEFQPGSNQKVLRNTFGFTNPDDVNRIEASLLAIAQGRSYRQIETDTCFTVSLIRELHRSWLRSVYSFAGEFRTIDLSKGSVRFAPVSYLENSLTELDRILEENTPCEGMGLERLITAIARVHAELVLVHPFREGNGRLSRWVADLMSLQAGYPPLEWGFDWEPEKRRERYFSALRRAFAMDFSPLEELVREALETAAHLAEDPSAEP